MYVYRDLTINREKVRNNMLLGDRYIWHTAPRPLPETATIITPALGGHIWCRAAPQHP